MAGSPPIDRDATRHGRRGFLRGAGLATLALLPAARVLAGPMPGDGPAAGDVPPVPPSTGLPGRRELHFLHTHTGESLSTVYFDAGTYQPAELAKVDVLLRDFRNEAVHPIDPQVLDRLCLLQAACGSQEPFQVISGYRSPATNEALRSRSPGVAGHSLHLEGRAIDVRLAGIRTSRLAVLARRQLGGGVGYYRVSDFVHVDTGAVRSWGDPLPPAA